MPTNFIQAKKRQRYLFIALAVLIVATSLVFWRGFFQQSVVVVIPVSSPKTPEITINFEILRDNKLTELNLFKSISSYEGKIGRENPFAP